ncbi:alpha/beta hydrolase [Streptomyces albireticuli]|uniref:alpha/beta hydrolase n=1 Tax=Streptomyces albireticuli TaxID=1940 RepID=UPI003675A170
MVHEASRRGNGGRARAGWTLAVLALLLTAVGAPPAGAGVPAENPARVVREVRIDDRTRDVQVRSPEIDGLTHTKWVRLLLPKGWSAGAARTWPTLWLLHGGGGDHKDWTAHTHVEELVADRDAIVVMPETSGCSAYSDWWNHGRDGAPKWETYLLDELRPLLERTYRADTRRAAVAGLSMGGLGALKFAAARPGAFRAAASYSGAVNLLHKSPDGGFDGPDAVKAGGLVCLTDWKRVWGEPGHPFDTTDPGDVRQRAIWQRNSPLYQAARLAGTPLYVSYGDGTKKGPDWKWGDPAPSPSRCTDPAAHGTDDGIERAVHGMNQEFRKRLAELRIPATVCASTGVHTWPYWERELVASFPMLMRALGV